MRSSLFDLIRADMNTACVAKGPLTFIVIPTCVPHYPDGDTRGLSHRKVVSASSCWRMQPASYGHRLGVGDATQFRSKGGSPRARDRSDLDLNVGIAASCVCPEKFAEMAVGLTRERQSAATIPASHRPMHDSAQNMRMSRFKVL